jgi:hypothetical protein
VNTRVVIACLAVLVGVAAGFYGGYSFGQAHASSRSGTGVAALTGAGGGTGAGAAGTFAGLRGCPSPRPSGARSLGNRNRGTATGTITLLTPSGFSVDNTRCGTQTRVTFGSSVTVVKTVTGSTSDLANNDNVVVIGTRESDGSIQATTIEITPAGTGLGGLGGFGGAGGGSTGSTAG